MASYHLSVKSVSRGQGRSAVAAAAYRAGERLECAREGRVHDYTRKRGVEAAFVVAPEGAPEWAQDRERLWNEAEGAERRKNSVVAREWEVALPVELGPEGRRGVVVDFARALAERYGVAADVAIHGPHREGDQRNHHAHVLTTTRALGEEGLGAKTRVLDAQATRGAEVTAMRALWAELQNEALARVERERGLEERTLDRVDHRSLAARREAALERGDAVEAEALDRPAEVHLGPAASALERRAERAAEARREAERARERRQEQERAQKLREERESVERVRRIVEGKRAREREREEARLRAERRPGIVAGLAALHEEGLAASEALAGLAPAEDVLAPLRAAEAALGERLPKAAAALGEPEERLADAVAERAEALRREREAGEPEGAERERRARESARGPFVEANARAWDAALWDAEQEAARTGRGGPAAEPEPGSPLAKERERLRTRIEHAAVRFGEPEGVLRGAIQARSDALDEERRPERDAEVARLEADRVAEQERLARSVSLPGLAAAVRAGRELDAGEREVVEAGLEPTLRRVIGEEELARLHLGDHRALAGALPDEGDQLAVAWAQLEARHARTDSGLASKWAGVMERRLEAWEDREAERAQAREAEEERRREAEREAERARSCEALVELAEGLRDWGWRRMGEADKERLRVGLGQHLERAVGAEGIDRLDRGDHTALEGVLESAEDRVVLTQARLFDHGALFRDEEVMDRGRGLYQDIIAGRIADERAERGLTEEQDLERSRARDLDDGLGL